MGSLRRFIAAGAKFAWPLDGQPLQEARDHHTVTGNPTVVDSPYGKALRFTGSEYITLDDSWEDQLRFDAGTDDFSVVAWLRLAALGSNVMVMSKFDAWGDGWHFIIEASNVARFRINGIQGAAPVITDTEWHCLIGTADRSGNILCYLDGVPGAGAALGGAVMATTVAPRIGAQAYDADYKFVGDMAGVVIPARALSQAECLGIATGKAF